MAGNDDWVADVKRWVRAGSAASPYAPRPDNADRDGEADVGYEAAHPVLQAAHWPDAPRRAFADSI